MSRAEIDHCPFPEDLLYDVGEKLWVRPEGREIVLGITCILGTLAGTISSIRTKPVGTQVGRGQSVATIESPTWFGAVRAPVSGRITVTNGVLSTKPALANRDPYGQGWFTRLLPNAGESVASLAGALEARRSFEDAIRSLRIRCFAVYPDHEVSGIGGECPETLVAMGELMAAMDEDESVHLVTDNPTAPRDVPAWAALRGYRILDERREGDLLHFVLGK